jgi:hypothetical protein
MTDERLTHETIEDAYRPVAEVLTRLPDGVEKREAARLLEESERVAHVSRERAIREDG